MGSKRVTIPIPRQKDLILRISLCRAEDPRVAKTRSKEMARRAENARRRELEAGYHGFKKRAGPKLFYIAADEWLELKKPVLAQRSYQIEQANLKHILPAFGKRPVTKATRTAAIKRVAGRPYGQNIYAA